MNHRSCTSSLLVYSGSWARSGSFLARKALLASLAPLLESDSPPWFTTLGLNVQRSEFEGMPVWTLQSPTSSSGKYVVGLHGGGYVLQPSLFHWLDYAAMARDTGATVVVPIYPLAPQGTAATVVPQIADLISAQIDQHGAENVSVYGDSAGGGLALAAVQELVRRGDPVPSHMVLISPALDVTLSDPASQTIDDPYLNASEVQAWGRLWAGDLDLADPRVSPLFGSLAGLPPTVVYSGSLDLLSPQVLRLRERALAEGADFTFVLRKGLIHDWAAVSASSARGGRRSPRHLSTARHRSRCLLVADRQPAGPSNYQRAHHRHPDARWPID